MPGNLMKVSWGCSLDQHGPDLLKTELDDLLKQPLLFPLHNSPGIAYFPLDYSNNLQPALPSDNSFFINVGILLVAKYITSH